MKSFKWNIYSHAALNSVCTQNMVYTVSMKSLPEEIDNIGFFGRNSRVSVLIFHVVVVGWFSSSHLSKVSVFSFDVRFQSVIGVRSSLAPKVPVNYSVSISSHSNGAAVHFSNTGSNSHSSRCFKGFAIFRIEHTSNQNNIAWFSNNISICSWFSNSNCNISGIVRDIVKTLVDKDFEKAVLVIRTESNSCRNHHH